MDIVNSIKRIVKEVVDGSSLVDIRYATIKSLEPLTIELQPTLLTIQSPIVVRMENTIEKKIIVHWEDTIDGTTEMHNDEYVVRDGLKVNDKVAVLRFNAGQNYLILDKVV